MPKNTNAHGPTYDGFEDASPSDRTQPEWVDRAEVQVDDTPEPKEEAKPKRKASTTAKAGAAKGTGSTRP